MDFDEPPLYRGGSLEDAPNELCDFSAGLGEVDEGRGPWEGGEFFEQLELMHFMAEDGEFSSFFSQKPQAEPAPYNGFFLDEPSWIGEKSEEGSTAIDVSEEVNTSDSLAESKLFLREELEEPSELGPCTPNPRLERARKDRAFKGCRAANSSALRDYTAAFLFDSDEELARAGEQSLGEEEFRWLVGFLRARVFTRGKQKKETLQMLCGDQAALRAQAHLLRRNLCHQRPIHTLRSLFPHLLRHLYRDEPTAMPKLSQSALTARFCVAFLRERGLVDRVRAALTGPELRAQVLQSSKRLFLRKFPYMAYKTSLAGRFTTARLGLVAKEFDDGAAMLLRLLADFKLKLP